MQADPPLSALLEFVHDGVLLLDLDQHIRFASASYQAMLGYGSEELRAHGGMERVLPEDRGAVAGTFGRALADASKSHQVEYRARHKDGRVLHLRAHGRHLPRGLPGWTDDPLVLVSVQDIGAERAAAQGEAFHRALVGNLNDGIIVLAMDQSAIYVSGSYARIAGLSAEAMRDSSVTQRVHPDDLDAVRRNFRAAVEGAQPRAVPYRLKGADGWVPLRGYCRYLPDGIPGYAKPCVMVVAADVSAEVEARRRLEESESFHRGVLEAFDDVVALLDREGRYTYVSPSVERLLGYRPEELLGRDGFQLLLPEDRSHMRDLFKRTLAEGRADRELEFRMRDAFGRVRVLAATGGPAHGLGGAAVMARLRDVTQARLNEEDLLRAERLAQLDQLIAGLAHELRNPLLAVSANAELLAASPQMAGEDRESVEAIRAQARRLRQLLDEALSRPMEKPPEAIEAAALLGSVLQEARRRFGPQAAKIDCAVDIQPGCPAMLAVPGRLELALSNVALNAFQAMPGGGVLRLAARADHGGVLVSVIDNGPGVAPGLEDELFDPFFTTRASASGLGLSTAKRIVEAHQGRLWATRLEPGLALHTWLPAAEAQA